jgi:hypothetical protein
MGGESGQGQLGYWNLELCEYALTTRILIRSALLEG